MGAVLYLVSTNVSHEFVNLVEGKRLVITRLVFVKYRLIQ